MRNMLQESADARVRLAHAVGTFALDYGFLEKNLNWAIAVLVPLESQAKADLLLGPIQSVDTRLNILESLVNGTAMDDAIRSDLLDVVSSARDLNSFRNWLLHGSWGGWVPREDKWQKLRTRTGKKLKYQGMEFSPSDIDAEAAKILPLVAKLSQTMKRFRP